uniref:Very-long-chain 3-oxoacyl-CoA reductase-B n=1 Tax=Sinocyclocheilus rhinocerous TaxID=307959 RepID=A0A673K554_9TELE
PFAADRHEIVDALYWIGAVTVAWVSVSTLCCLLNGTRVWIVGNGNLMRATKLGKWAGWYLARRGFAIVLISRTQEKLDEVSKAIESKYNVETKTISADFGSVDIYPKIESGLAGLEIGVLVNNVGVSYSYPEFFLNIPNIDSFISNMININITSVCQVRESCSSLKSKGVILNVASASGMYPVPLLTLYSSSKAFVDFFSRGLAAEYKSKGIIIQSVLPFYVTTKLSKIRRATLDIPSPERYVKAQLCTVGLQTQSNGYFPHAVMGWVTTALLPAKLLNKYVMSMGLSQRARYLKKQKQG